MKIGTNIRTLREAKGLLQKQVANELEIGYTNYNKVESGVREPSIEELQKLAKFFGVSVRLMPLSTMKGLHHKK